MGVNAGSIRHANGDSVGVVLNNKINGLYYYYLDRGLFNTGSDNTSIMGTTDAIANICYTPFLNIDSSDLYSVNYDTDRYGTISGSAGNPKVFRISSHYRPQEIPLISKHLYKGLTYPPKLHMPRNYIYESKLWDYPYRTIIFYSNVFDKYEVIPQLVNPKATNNGLVSLVAFTPVTTQGNFYLNVAGYKNYSLGIGNMERYFCNSSFDIPNTSSAYSNFISTQKAQATAGYQSTVLGSQWAVQSQKASNYMASASTLAGGVNGVLGGSGIFGRILNGVGGGVDMYNQLAIQNKGMNYMAQNQANLNNHLAKENLLAQHKDLTTTPNSLKSLGSDILSRIGADEQAKVYAGELTIT